MSLSDVAVGARLHAVTRAIETPQELLDHLGEDGFAWFGEDVAFVTAGVAAEVEPAAAADLLRAVQHDAAAGIPNAAGPLAVGALPFSGNGRLVVPDEIVGITPNGRAWATTIDGRAPARARRHDAPNGYRVEAVATQPEWASSVETALGEIESGALLKVVLAREVRVSADSPFDIVGVLAHLRRAQPGCFVFADRGFVGATPELLVRRAGERVTCRPMAGTMPRGSNNQDVVAR
ncbi:MAG: dhbC, partial [Actinomycetia bacterium]|nr:dhbC [Actinomycetes bacterium]